METPVTAAGARSGSEKRDGAAVTGWEASEAFAALQEMVSSRKNIRVPANWLARHVMRLYGEGDWPLQRGAMEAVLRRLQFARRDGLRVAGRPGGGQPLGSYTTRRPREKPRPYRTVIERLDPLVASCDCPDFIGGSLGLCKHVLVVVDELAAKPRQWRRAEQGELEPPSPRLTWDCVRPLRGGGDPLERVELVTKANGAAGSRRSRRGTSTDRIARWLAGHPTDEEGRRWRLASTHAGDPAKRLTLVDDLLGFVRRRRRNRELEPGLEAMLDAERARLERVSEARASRRDRERALRSLRRKLYPYQKEGVRRFLSEGRLLLADDMGLGKTAQAIAGCHALWKTGAVGRGLLVVPASLKHQWAREWQRFTNAPIEVVEGGPEERAALYENWRKGFLVANYEQVLRDLALMQDWQPEVVVLDEAQRIKNWATKTAAHVKALAPRYRLVLTGTPFENRLEELASVMDWIDPHALQPKWRLEPWHTIYQDGLRERAGARNLDTLRERLSHCMVRRRRPEILDQLPERTDTMIPVELTEAQRTEHDELTRPIKSIVEKGKRRPLTQQEFLRLMMLLTTQRIIANGIAQLRFAEMWPGIEHVRRPDDGLLSTLCAPKLGELRELISRIAVEQERKLVVFSQWRRMLRLAQWAVRDLLEDAGLRSVFFTGQEKARRRQHNIIDLHDDPSVRVLFATDAGGIGLNLQRACTCCINIDLPWNPAVLEQRVGRIYRIGQDEPIDVINLVSQDCIEDRIASLVSDKKALFRGLFDGDTDEVRYDESGSFLEGVKQLIEPAQSDDGAATGIQGEAEEDVDDDERDAEERAATDRALDTLADATDDAEQGVSTDDASEGRTAPAPPSNGGARQAEQAGTFETARETSIEGAAPTRDDGDATERSATSSVQEAMSRMRIERTDDGGMRIEAPPEAADTLATLFEQMGKLLRAQS